MQNMNHSVLFESIFKKIDYFEFYDEFVVYFTLKRALCTKYGKTSYFVHFFEVPHLVPGQCLFIGGAIVAVKVIL